MHWNQYQRLSRDPQKLHYGSCNMDYKAFPVARNIGGPNGNVYK